MSVVTDASDDFDVETSGTNSPSSSLKSAQWKFRSKFLGMELEAEEALKLQYELQQAIRASKKKTKAKVSTRLLQPTTSFKQSEYQKPSPKSLDSREVGWNSVNTKSSQSPPSSVIRQESVPVESLKKKSKKVIQTSSRLLEVNDVHKYKAPVTAEIVVAEALKKLAHVKPINPNTHLLKPKEATRVSNTRVSRDNDDYEGSIISSRSGNPNTSTQAFLMKSPRFGKDETLKIKSVQAISSDSHLLQRSKSRTNRSGADHNEADETSTNNSETEVSLARKKSMRTGPKDVESRLLQLTASARAAAWTGPKGPTDEEIAEQRWQEEQAKKEPIMVVRPSERLLMRTVANEHAVYKKPEERDETLSILSTDDSARVVEVSPRLLQLTTAAEGNVYKGPTQFPIWTNKDSADTPIKIGGRLLEGTTAYEKGKYQKLDIDIDPREIGWKFYGPKKDDMESTEEDESNTTSEAPVMKVKETSERVLSLTAAYHARRKSPEDHHQSLSSPKPRAVASNEHFLQPTESYRISSTISAQLRGEDDASDSSHRDQSPKPYKPIPASLLAPTASYENRLKGTSSSDTDSVDSPTTHSPVIRSVTSSERFLAPTASYVNRLATVDETKPLHPVSPSIAVKPVLSNARFLEQTASSAGRLSVSRQDSIGNLWIDALGSSGSVASDRRSASPSISSIYSKTTLSSVSVKSLVSAFESNKSFGRNPIRVKRVVL